MASTQGIRAGRAFVELFADDSKLVRGQRRAERKLRTFGDSVRNLGLKMAALGSAMLAPLAASAKLFSGYGDQVAKMAKRTGLSVETLSELRFVASQTGTEFETLENAFRKMQRSIYDAGRGLSTQVDALNDLGLTFQDLDGLSPEDQFKLLADRISQVEDPTKKAALAMSLFGRTGTNLLPMFASGAKGIEILQAEARRLGLTMSSEDAKAAEDFTDALDRLWKVIKMGVFHVGAALAPVLQKVADTITTLAVQISAWVQRNQQLIVAAVSLSLERRLKRLKGLRKLGKLKQEFGEIPDELEDLTEAERWKFEDDVVERLTLASNMAELETEIADLEGLVLKAKRTARNPLFKETKFEELRQVISEHVSGKNERLLVFTEHKDTLDYLVSKLGDLGFHCCTIHGGMPLPKRIDAEREFYEHCPSVMIATEAAGEGINLQFCSLMVNYDIPWNPNRLEQRMGRIHRYKQQKEVMIFNLVASNTREGEVVARLLMKLEDMKTALGSDRVYDVIGEIISAPEFDKLMRDWLSSRRTLQEILAEIDISTDETQIARIRSEMTDKALGSRFIDMSALADQVRQSKEQRLMPEYIERFFVEAYRSFGGTITDDKSRKGLWTITHVPPDIRKLPESIERRFGKIGQTYPRLTFDKANTGAYQEVEFIGPGHPLFEGVVDRVLREYGPALLRGAIFYNADSTSAEILWLLKTGIEDGHGRTIGQRLSGVHKQDDGFRRIQPYALLDLKSPDQPPALDAAIKDSAHDEDEVIDWALDAVVAPYFQEVSERRNHELAIKEKYIRKSLNFLIGESNRKIMDYDRKIGSFLNPNDPQALNIKGNRAQEATRRDELVHRRDARLAELEHEKQLSEQPPEVLGVSVILPMTPSPDAKPAAAAAMKSDPEVEAIAVQVVKKHEESEGRKPISVEEENCGWDITSLSGGQVARYIEVKGRAADGAVALTPNEWIKAQRFGKDYWLYIVTQCKSDPQLHLIQDPASKLTPSEEVSVVRYMVKPDDWKAATSEVTA